MKQYKQLTSGLRYQGRSAQSLLRRMKIAIRCNALRLLAPYTSLEFHVLDQ